LRSQIFIGRTMDFSRLEYIKNVNDDDKWAYKDYPIGAYFPLNFKKSEGSVGVDSHALNLPKGAFIILSQKHFDHKRYLTHIVELVNEGSEDRPQWDESDTWGIFRWVKVHWVADFNNPSNIPLDQEVSQANWGWFNTQEKSLNSENLMSHWKNIESLRTHLQAIFK